MGKTTWKTSSSRFARIYRADLFVKKKKGDFIPGAGKLEEKECCLIEPTSCLTSDDLSKLMQLLALPGDVRSSSEGVIVN